MNMPGSSEQQPMSELKSGARLRAEAAKAIDAVVSEGRSLDAVLAEIDGRINPVDRPWSKCFVMALYVFTGACVHSYASL
jgi:hypothetical protein